MPNIPDKLYKLSLIIGLFLVGFSWTKTKDGFNEYNVKYERFDGLTDSLKLLKQEIVFDQDNFISKCSEIEYKHNIDSLYYMVDDEIIFSKPLSNEPILKSDVLSLEKIWFQIKELQHKEELLMIKISDSSADHDEAKKDLTYWQEEFNIMQKIGVFLIGLGVVMWFIDENNRPQEKEKQFDKIYDSCQSCGNRFSSIRKYGKNTDNTYNLGLCNDCFEYGEFVEKELTNEIAFIRYCKKHKITNRIHKYLIKLMFGRLERWKS